MKKPVFQNLQTFVKKIDYRIIFIIDMILYQNGVETYVYAVTGMWVL